ncbi:type II 3-dehydroquinate dehydratase [Caldalkalibacillus mannanilyticus]|uniref:type II 3-dehydroquinate dehydratase n=1 Tax=Caldalkalibacillus mannanilyticus TaxID=1418 RepID=UPI00046AD901|nr:type II 3-dehydroquinate dehydratase [Caldalkalibacillus mannanilyticus]
MRSLLVLNGPNINRLGLREPEVYGHRTLEDLVSELQQWGNENHILVNCFQSNHEGELIDQIHQAEGKYLGIIINPGAFTHYSYAIRDAIASISLPVIEVHISNVYQREEFRHHSVVAPVCQGQIAGLGFIGYRLALEAMIHGVDAK